jgi:hypothetical protein
VKRADQCNLKPCPDEADSELISKTHVCEILRPLRKKHHHHYQPINVPTSGAQAFLMDYTLEKQTITQHAGPVWVGEC